MEHVTKAVKVNERKLRTAMERVEASTYDELDWEETEVKRQCIKETFYC